jgi:hypothetical protein
VRGSTAKRPGITRFQASMTTPASRHKPPRPIASNARPAAKHPSRRSPDPFAATVLPPPPPGRSGTTRVYPRGTAGGSGGV